MHYLALVFHDEDGGYGFTVPDIRGFTAHAEKATLDAALKVARDVLRDHLAALVDAGHPIPEARDPGEVLADPAIADELAEATTTIMLPAILPAGRTMRINLTMDENTLDLVDTAAAARNLTRSAFIAEASRRFAVGERGAVRDPGAVDAAMLRDVASWFGSSKSNTVTEAFSERCLALPGGGKAAVVDRTLVLKIADLLSRMPIGEGDNWDRLILLHDATQG